MPNAKKYSELTSEQKSKWYGQNRNERRRAAYAANRAHRTEVQQRNRESYLNKFGTKRSGINMPDPDTTMQNVSQSATRVAIISPDGNKFTHKVVDTSALVRIFGLGNLTRLYRMQSKDMFPRPVYEATGDNISVNSKMVYLVEEVKAMLPVWMGHYSNKSLYREDHMETRVKLFAAVERVRSSIK